MEVIHGTTRMIRTDSHLMPHPLESQRLFQDADVAAIVGEERGWSNVEDPIGG